MSPGLPRELSRSFPGLPASASAVRDFVREACAGALDDEQLDIAVLLTSELVANAIQHTDSEHFDVHIAVDRRGIRISVRDRDKGSPVLGAPSPESSSGRGLQLVDRLSGAWGVNYGQEGGKRVWFDVGAAAPLD